MRSSRCWRATLTNFEQHMGHAPELKDITNPVMIPNQKADFNNNGPVSTDYIGHSWKYPEPALRQKAAIWQDHFCTRNLSSISSRTTRACRRACGQKSNQWGLPKDEFADTDHWPNQLYIREGRRHGGRVCDAPVGLADERTKPDSIGMGSYNSDSHNVQRVAMPDGTVQNEGDVQVPVEPYEISYRIITPKRSQVRTCWCRSASRPATLRTRLCAWSRST